ncbi:structural maintenance of chromosomes protein 5 [Contarinia nasturtii]|uniref:structural maintenance of chromosomes protein 5 n=1 Tax=Contarinia nasturtii TaxID=265458 RepID=UPI0012D3E0A1|nr:structural maintenance of chromosomes protein 5 [Contarinia nasturtii]
MDIDSSDDEQSMVSDDASIPNKHLIAGKIVKIHLKDFLTHTEAIVHPSEHLNLVIGPNGTGKSSIVASIIIGMGGSTKILSERNKLNDYVKNGKENAHITITVYKDERRTQTNFTREFNRKNKSTYYIDQRKVTEKQYVDEINALNVQVGNLCQFLPQERVQDFAKQNPQELFASTQKSVCTEEMIETFDKLKELRHNQLSDNKNVQRTQDLLREHERHVELLEPTIASIRERDILVNQKNMIEKKLAWMDFQESYAECLKISADLEVTQKKYDEAMEKKNDLQKHIESKAKERQKYEKSLSAEVSKKRKYCNDLDQIGGEIEKLEIELRNAQCDLDIYIRNAEERDQKMDENQLVLNTYKQECENYLQTIGSVEQVENMMTEIDMNIEDKRTNVRKLTEARAKVNGQIDNEIRPYINNIDYKIKALNSVADAKLNYLQTQHSDTYNAVQWLRNNHDMFRGKIYEPMVMEINVRSNEYSKYIENCVRIPDLIAFTCEETEDMNKFIKIMRVDNNWQVNVIHSPAANGLLSKYKPREPISELRKLGGEIYMVDCIEAPFPILNFLCQTYGVQNVLIGNQNLERKADLLPDSLGLFFTPTHRVVLKKSKYTNSKSLMSNVLRAKNMLNVRVSQRELDDLEAEKTKQIQKCDQLRNTRNQIETKINQLEQECKAGFQEKSEHQKHILEYRTLTNKIKQQENKIRRLMNEAVDVDAEKEKFDKRSKDIIKNMIKFHETSITTYDQMMKIELNEVKAKARLVIFKNGTTNFDAELMECNDEITTCKTYCDRIGEVLDKKKQEAKDKQVKALSLTENHRPTEGDKFPYKEKFDELSDDKSQLKEEYDDLEQKISCRSSNDQAVLEDYNERLKQIESLKKDLRKRNKTTAEMEIEISKLHNKWYPKINDMVNSINRNFTDFMTSMDCAGEVELIYPSDRDYEQYGIEIRVKYRSSEKLRALNRFVQSGGERAVAIAVYSLSLQHLSQVPFRCVDEINQGMDPNNERLVFEMLVNNVAQPGQSQFFYVTPKLQTNLPYNPYVNCITVFNGPYTNRHDLFEDV